MGEEVGEEQELKEARWGGTGLWSQEHTRCGQGTAMGPVPLERKDCKEGSGREGLPMLKIMGQTLCKGSPTAGCPSWLPEVSLHPREDGCFLCKSGLRAAWVFGSPHQLSLP